MFSYVWLIEQTRPASAGSASPLYLKTLTILGYSALSDKDLEDNWISPDRRSGQSTRFMLNVQHIEE